MASYTVKVFSHKTLAASTVDTATFAQGPPQITVINRDGTAEIYFTVNGTTPTVGGDDTFVLPAAVGQLTVPAPQALSEAVKLISAGTPKYSVGTLS